MGKAFRDLLAQANGGDADAIVSTSAPRAIVVVPPSGFAETWKNRPTEPVRIGLRLISEDQIDKARANAIERAMEFHPSPTEPIQQAARVEAYNAALMREVLVHACCSPADVDEPYFKVAPNETIRIALRDVTVRRLWEEYERLTATSSPLTPQASDEQIGHLGARLLDVDLLAGLQADESARLRRLFTFLRDQLEAAGVDVD